jgi:hypothetical protein
LETTGGFLFSPRKIDPFSRILMEKQIWDMPREIPRASALLDETPIEPEDS